MLSPKNEPAYLVLEEVVASPLTKNNIKDENMEKCQQVLENGKSQRDCVSLNKRGQNSRLHELQQQLEIAETRCGTLKQQLDYMKSLYQGVQRTSYCKQKNKKDSSKRKSRSRDKVKRVPANSSLEKKFSESSLKKTVNKMPSSSSSSAKTSPRYFTTASKLERGFDMTQISNLITDLTKQGKFSSYEEEKSDNFSYELPIRDFDAQSKSANIKEQSRPSSALQYKDSPQLQQETIEENMSQEDGKLKATSSAVQVIQNILSGITDSVNQISQLNVYINDDGKESAATSQNEESTEKKLCQDQHKLPTNLNCDEDTYLTMKIEQEDVPAVVKTFAERDKQFNLNSCSDSNVENIYNSNFNRIQTDVNLTRKHNKPRTGKREVPPRLLANYKTDSIESIRGNKRKGKLHGRQTDKKTKGLYPYSQLNTNKVKQNVTEDVISVTTKIKRKRNTKLKSCNSRSTIGCRPDKRDLTRKKHQNRGTENEEYSHVPIPYQVWHGDNVVELYHNSSLRTDMSASEENFTRYSHASKSTLKSMQKYPHMQEILHREEYEQRKRHSQKLDSFNIKQHNDDILHMSDGSGDEMMTAERIMQNVMEPMSNEGELHRSFDISHHDCQNPVLNVVIPPVDMDGNVTPLPGEHGYSTSLKRNFQLPTVSSKMKQVDRSYFRRFNFRNIPFVAATSTSPSHNLGLNIQQVLSIIKMRQPIGGITPAGIINHHFSGISQRPCIAPTSQSSSHTVDHKSFCPATLSADLPEIPEKDSFSLEPNFMSDFGPSSQQCKGQHSSMRPITALPFFNEEMKHNSIYNKEERAEDAWTPEQNDFVNKHTKSNLHCTCFPTRRCVNYQKILNQYLEGSEKLSFLRATPPECNIPYKPQSLRPHYSTMSRTQHDNRTMVSHVMSGQSLNEKRIAEMSAMKEVQKNTINYENTNCNKKSRSPDFFVDIQGRAKSLKEVLTNLHDDFSRLNSKYEELQAGVTQDTVDETEAMKQLEAMESELQTKEDEITVVMALYKEVMLLKEQVRALRERTSLANFAPQPARRIRRRLIVREPTIAVRLTKILRNIQQFQDKLRRD